MAAFEFDMEGNLLRLQEELRQERYHPEGYFNFTIHEPKQRLVSAAPFRDRVVHHALCQVIEPIWERRLVEECCLPDRSWHRVLRFSQLPNASSSAPRQ